MWCLHLDDPQISAHLRVPFTDEDWICCNSKDSVSKYTQITQDKLVEKVGNVNKLGITLSFSGNYSHHALLQRGMNQNLFDPSIKPVRNYARRGC